MIIGILFYGVQVLYFCFYFFFKVLAEGINIDRATETPLYPIFDCSVISTEISLLATECPLLSNVHITAVCYSVDSNYI